MNKFAHLSEDGIHRYTLTRLWDETRPVLTFIMLNPSTADADTDDATIRKCIGFGQRLGFGSILVVNLFSFRTRDPDTLRAAGYPGGGRINNKFVSGAVRHARDSGGSVCCAWGSNARYSRVFLRSQEVLSMLKEQGIKAYALRILSDGIPSHPLMLPYTLTLKEFQ